MGAWNCEPNMWTNKHTEPLYNQKASLIQNKPHNVKKKNAHKPSNACSLLPLSLSVSHTWSRSLGFDIKSTEEMATKVVVVRFALVKPWFITYHGRKINFMFVSGYAISTIDAFCFSIDLRTMKIILSLIRNFAASVSCSNRKLSLSLFFSVFSINKIYVFLIIFTLCILLAYQIHLSYVPIFGWNWMKNRNEHDKLNQYRHSYSHHKVLSIILALDVWVYSCIWEYWPLWHGSFSFWIISKI